jgi:hypothetical protein
MRVGAPPLFSFLAEAIGGIRFIVLGGAGPVLLFFSGLCVSVYHLVLVVSIIGQSGPVNSSPGQEAPCGPVLGALGLGLGLVIRTMG